MRYRLRTLLILMAIGPPIVAWHVWPRMREAYVAWSAGDKDARLSEIQTAGGGVSAIGSKIERMRQLQIRIAELEVMIVMLEKELDQERPKSKEAFATIAALEQQIAQLQLQLSWMRSSSILRTTPSAPFLKPKTSDPPGPLRFSPGIERAMLHEGTQRK